MTKAETRMTKEVRNPKPEILLQLEAWDFTTSDFEVLAYFVIRHSSFGLLL